MFRFEYNWQEGWLLLLPSSLVAIGNPKPAIPNVSNGPNFQGGDETVLNIHQ